MLKENNSIEYPFEYFDAQVLFAFKWSDLSGDPMQEVLWDKTCIYRRLTGENPAKVSDPKPVWYEFLGLLQKERYKISRELYALYVTQPIAIYKAPVYPENDGKHFGFFSFDYYTNDPRNDNKNTIKIHFINLERGEKSGLASTYSDRRNKNLKSMFTFIKAHYPEAEIVTGGSWMYHLDSYRNTFPQEYIRNMKRLVPEGFENNFENSTTPMSFQGNSLWGQFISKYGYVREPSYSAFLVALDKADTLKGLLNAFSEPPLKPSCDIDIFYNYLGI